MGFILFLVWYMVAILPMFIVMEAWARFKKYMDTHQKWDELPYYLLIALIVLLLIVLSAESYR